MSRFGKDRRGVTAEAGKGAHRLETGASTDPQAFSTSASVHCCNPDPTLNTGMTAAATNQDSESGSPSGPADDRYGELVRTAQSGEPQDWSDSLVDEAVKIICERGLSNGEWRVLFDLLLEHSVQREDISGLLTKLGETLAAKLGAIEDPERRESARLSADTFTGEVRKIARERHRQEAISVGGALLNDVFDLFRPYLAPLRVAYQAVAWLLRGSAEKK